MDYAAPSSVHEARLSLSQFLGLNATRIWATMIKSGVQFLVPPSVPPSSSAGEISWHLVRRERERVHAAELYHLDAAATRTAMSTKARPREIGTLVPSGAGLVVWEEPITMIDENVPIVAAVWGPSDGGAIWASWWSDTSANAAHGGCHVQAILSVIGWLTFDRECMLLPGTWPRQLDESSLVGEFYRGLFGTWEAISGKLLGAPDTIAAPEELTAALSQQGLASRHASSYQVHRNPRS
jgi:hypothetical protein